MDGTPSFGSEYRQGDRESGDPSVQNPVSRALEELNGLDKKHLLLAEALAVAARERNAALGETDAAEAEPAAGSNSRPEVEKVASGLRELLGSLDFGPRDRSKDPLHISSLRVAEGVVYRVKNLLNKLHFSHSDEEKQKIFEQAERMASDGFKLYSGTPDQALGEDIDDHPIFKRAREYAPEIVAIIAASVGVAAVAATVYKHKRGGNG